MTLHVESLDAEGRGVARTPEGKVVFVEGALPGEDVDFQVLKKKLSHEFARATSIQHASSSRVTPRCPHFGVCGGCATQHADVRTQMAAKQRWLEENLARIGKVGAETMLPIVYGQEWGYRNRARLSVRRVPKKGGVLVGFREKRSTYVADMRECPVLPPHVSALIPRLKALISMGRLSAAVQGINNDSTIPAAERSQTADSLINVMVQLSIIGSGIAAQLQHQRPSKAYRDMATSGQMDDMVGATQRINQLPGGGGS